MTGSCINWSESQFLTSFFRFISWFGDGVIVPVVIVLSAASYFLFVKKDRVFALVLGITPLAGQVLKALLKNYFQQPRPETLGCRTLTTYADRFSFPSGHTIFYVIFFGLIAYYYLRHKKEKESKLMTGVSAGLILFVGFSRVYLGAHWYSDVIGGYLVGGTLLSLAVLIYNRLSKKKETK